MFAILRSKISVAALAIGAVLLLSAQSSKEDVPQDKDIIAAIKNNGRIDFRKYFPSDWEAICFSGQYQHPIRDIKYELGKDFAACSGAFSNTRYDGLQAVSIIWNDRCRVIEISTSDFFIESQNGTSCYRREAATEFSLQKFPVGTILAPSN